MVPHLPHNHRVVRVCVSVRARAAVAGPGGAVGVTHNVEHDTDAQRVGTVHKGLEALVATEGLHSSVWCTRVVPPAISLVTESSNWHAVVVVVGCESGAVALPENTHFLAYSSIMVIPRRAKYGSRCAALAKGAWWRT